MADVLEDHHATISIWLLTISNFRFIDDIGGLTGSEEKFAYLLKQLDDIPSRYGMEVSAEKSDGS